MPVPILETERLVLRRLNMDDAPFILKLVNEPSWLRYIGDKGVRNLADARNYLQTGPITMYEQKGFGLYMTELRGDCTPIGMCGLIKRATLEDVDVGFAFLPGFWGQGYAQEAAAAVLQHGRATLGIPRIVAITSPDNARSIRLLDKLGFSFEKMLEPATDGRQTSLYALQD